jgi:dTDP-4-amino-4,6-dideoxygalactose transaminase
VRVLTSATEGLEIALERGRRGPGDEVIVPAMSFAASANVVARLGAIPNSWTSSCSRATSIPHCWPARLTEKTRAIMPVHFSGLPVDMTALYAFAEKHRLRVVEDAAHAIGSRYAGKPIGSFGDLVVFSFHPNKNMTTIEGGAIATADHEAIELIEQHRFHGIKRNAEGEIDVLFPGAKSNLSDVAAQIGIDQLRRLDGFNARRRELAARYFEELADYRGVVLPARGDADTAGTCSSCSSISRRAHHASRVPTRDGAARNRDRRALPLHPGPVVLPRARLPGRGHAGRGARRPRDRHAAAVSGDERCDVTRVCAALRAELA